jgi:hypothetical protein
MKFYEHSQITYSKYERASEENSILILKVFGINNEIFVH